MTADVTLIATEVPASISAVCRALEMPRSSHYARRVRKPSSYELANRHLDARIKSVYAAHRGRYGAPRVHAELRAEGQLSRRRVATRMQALALQGRRPKRFRVTTQADPKHTPAPNLLDREFTRERPDEAWVGDITYVWTLEGWCYLALLIDLCTRSIVGWSVSKHCDTALARRALDQAVARRRPPPGLLHHTDRGSTYTADAYREALKLYGMTCSMSRRGNCWDNAVAESTIGTIKAELLDDILPEDVHDLGHRLFPYIEGYYNRRRRHSTLGFQTPAEYEKMITAPGAGAI